MKRRSTAKPPFARASKRAHALIDAMLKEMQLGLREPARLKTIEWERLFGPKQSMVVNLQKLVQALSVLPVEEGKQPSNDAAVREGAALNAEEMQLLTAWLEDGKSVG